MAVNKDAYVKIKAELERKNVVLVAVSKTKPVEDIMELYQMGQRDFGENYVQELQEKQAALPADIRWHFIGHLQSNKVKYIAPFVYTIQGVDSIKLLKEINKQGVKLQRNIDCLLQVHIAQEETKFGFDETELTEAIVLAQSPGMHNIKLRGLMGMASFTEDMAVVRNEFAFLRKLFDNCNVNYAAAFDVLSMGMSGDYSVAVEEGSTMVRIGSLLFGARDYA